MRLFFIGPRIFGIRPGISINPRDLRTRTPSSTVEGSFLYVVQGTHDLVKIGVSKDPNERLAALQTGSPFPLAMPYIVATPGSGFDIEAEAHRLLDSHRVQGEWFSVRTRAAVEAIGTAAASLGQPILPVDAALADRILHEARYLAASGAGTPPRRSNAILWTLCVLGALITLWVTSHL